MAFLTCGVPQGYVLGPLLVSAETITLFIVIVTGIYVLSFKKI